MALLVTKMGARGVCLEEADLAWWLAAWWRAEVMCEVLAENAIFPLVAVEMEHISVVVDINRESCMMSDEAECSWCLFRGG